MNSAMNQNTSWLSRYQTEWSSLLAHRHNVLIEGPAVKARAVLRLLRPHITEPVAWKKPDSPLELPNGELGAIVLEDASTLSVEDQTHLVSRLQSTRSRLQIISTTEQSLFALVERGRFDPGLYYRLNVVLLLIDAQSDPHGSAAEAAASEHMTGPKHDHVDGCV